MTRHRGFHPKKVLISCSDPVSFPATVVIVTWHSLLSFPSTASKFIAGSFEALGINLVIDISQVVWTRRINLLLFDQALLEL